jgi:hypothetical protein
MAELRLLLGGSGNGGRREKLDEVGGKGGKEGKDGEGKAERVRGNPDGSCADWGGALGTGMQST